MLIVALIFCLPLWAQETVHPLTDLLPLTLDIKEETDPSADLPLTLSLEYGSQRSYGRIEDQIFNFRITHNGEFFSQIDMDWAVLSHGAKCLDDNWWAGLTAKYRNPPHERSGLVGSTVEPAQMFLQLHHRTRRIEGRFYIPLILEIEDQKVNPWVEIERLTLIEVGQTSLFLRGQYELGGKPEFDFGVCQRIKFIEARALASGNWSIRASASTNF